MFLFDPLLLALIIAPCEILWQPIAVGNCATCHILVEMNTEFQS